MKSPRSARAGRFVTGSIMSQRPDSSSENSPAALALRSVSRTVEGAAPTRTEIALWPSPCSNRYRKISRTRRMLTLSADINRSPRTRQKEQA
ncbi:MAG: hypothetical protein B7Z40_13175 [Bosea sp. 12-68-7]|nr:MAG: hypothetical protein B7Z40_13175 [Bosea sp. 12-68-7]